MSPLENHHCAISFKILGSPECNIFTNLSPEEFKEVRGVKFMRYILCCVNRFLLHIQDIIILILATDMARHAEILENFKQKLDNFDYSSEDHLNTLKMILIKACDISNECRPLNVSLFPNSAPVKPSLAELVIFSFNPANLPDTHQPTHPPRQVQINLK